MGPAQVVSGQKMASHHYHTNLTVFLVDTINLVHILSPLADEIIEISLIPPTCRCQLWTWKFGKWMEVDIVYEATRVPGKEATESKAPNSRFRKREIYTNCIQHDLVGCSQQRYKGEEKYEDKRSWGCQDVVQRYMASPLSCCMITTPVESVAPYLSQSGAISLRPGGIRRLSVNLVLIKFHASHKSERRLEKEIPERHRNHSGSSELVDSVFIAEKVVMAEPVSLV